MVGPERIIKELDELWVSLSRQANGEDESGVLRACALTLIVVAEESDDAAAIGETLAESMREHPSRAIVIRLRPGSEPFLDARVYAQCWLPLGHHRQICSEQIEITSSGTSLADVPAVLLALTVPDLPVVIWCRCADLFQSISLRELFRLADKSIIDSSGMTDLRSVLRELTAAVEARRIVADLAWTRLTRWREMIAQVFEDPDCLGCRGEISEVRVDYTGAAIPVAAYYVAAWLAVALAWQPQDARLRFQSVGGPTGLEGITMAAPDMTISLQRGNQNEINLRVGSFLHRTSFPVLTESTILGEELAILGRDPIYEGTLAAAHQIAHVERS
jgi:glucose-6-phosphate dehydrogenase assembly protein OpcA